MPDTAIKAPEQSGALSSLRLNLGCGRNIMDGWVNLDRESGPGIDVVADLERCRARPLPFDDDSVDELLLSHVLEHVQDSLGLMDELWRIAKPGAALTVRCPYGGSDDAWEDQTHVRAYFHGSWIAFSQPYYWRADYSYRGDWQPEVVMLSVSKERLGNLKAQAILERIDRERNVVIEQIAVLRKFSPRRDPVRELLVAPRIQIHCL